MSRSLIGWQYHRTSDAWEVEEIDSTLLRQVGEREYRKKNNETNQEITGAPGEFFFTFEALQSELD